MRLSIFCLVCSLFLCSSASGSNLIKSYEIEKNVYQLCADADSSLNSGRYEEAIRVLEKAACFDPTSYSGNVHRLLSDAYRKQKKYNEAANEAELAIKYDPQRSEALYALAQDCYNADRFDAAVHALQRYIQVSKDEPWKAEAQKQLKEIKVYRNLQEAKKLLVSESNLERARKLLEVASTYDCPDHAVDVHCDLANVYQRLGLPERAIVEAKRTLKLSSGNKYALYVLGLAYQDIGDFDQAIVWFTKYMEVENDERERATVREFIEQLAFDRSKQAADNTKPDYLDLLRAHNDANQWMPEKLPLKVYSSSGSAVEGYRKPFRAFIVRALDTWCNASKNKLNYVLIDDKAQADVIVNWTHDPVTMKEGGKARRKAGVTTPETIVCKDGVERVQKCSVVIQTVRAYTGSRVPDGEMAAVCMHEMGHVMGLGHSACVSDIMYFGCSSKQTGRPTDRDRATIARLYQDFPTLAFSPKLDPKEVPEIKENLSPPLFLPPKPPSTLERLFMPPPRPESDHLVPPLFSPPPPTPDPAKMPSNANVTELLFQPPPPGRKWSKQSPANVTKSQSEKQDKVRGKGNKENLRVPPLFTPPPPEKQ